MKISMQNGIINQFIPNSEYPIHMNTMFLSWIRSFPYPMNPSVIIKLLSRRVLSGRLNG